MRLTNQPRMKFSDRAKKAMRLAGREAQNRGNKKINTLHLLWAILTMPKSQACIVLVTLGFNPAVLRRKLEQRLSLRNQKNKKTPEIIFRKNASCEKALEAAENFAKENNCKLVSTCCLLLGILRDEENLASKFLKEHRIRFDCVSNKIKRLKNLGQLPEEKSFLVRVLDVIRKLANRKL